MNYLHARTKKPDRLEHGPTGLCQSNGTPTFRNQQSVCARSWPAIPGILKASQELQITIRSDVTR